jgi:hypothetical protein
VKLSVGSAVVPGMNFSMRHFDTLDQNDTIRLSHCVCLERVICWYSMRGRVHTTEDCTHRSRFPGLRKGLQRKARSREAARTCSGKPGFFGPGPKKCAQIFGFRVTKGQLAVTGTGGEVRNKYRFPAKGCPAISCSMISASLRAPFRKSVGPGRIKILTLLMSTVMTAAPSLP